MYGVLTPAPWPEGQGSLVILMRGAGDRSPGETAAVTITGPKMRDYMHLDRKPYEASMVPWEFGFGLCPAQLLDMCSHEVHGMFIITCGGNQDLRLSNGSVFRIHVEEDLSTIY
ncbi:hypothetical protein Tco_0153984 [Tanacetum coccineum]